MDHSTLWCPEIPYAGLLNIVVNGLACHLVVSVCLLGRNFKCTCWARKTQAVKRFNWHY